MIPNDSEYQALYAELEKYEKYGIPMTMGGQRVSPLQVVSAHMIKESGTYMRDYVMNDAGHIEELTFQEIKEENTKNH